ncbi:heat shock protein beta-7-like [Platysternon megacephalum]|uniref:Heat shock protein beta-7-like n=1 Tax=Platysternon megacephalum TaxID=55544 RepID=A0A4D9DTS1_9SAUR|nr:heat shock protein beta-7-like [Platysternon megacephalum]
MKGSKDRSLGHMHWGKETGRGSSLGNGQKEERARKGQSPVSPRQREYQGEWSVVTEVAERPGEQRRDPLIWKLTLHFTQLYLSCCPCKVSYSRGLFYSSIS